MNIAIIGTGNIAWHLTARLSKTKHKVLIWGRSPQKTAQFVKHFEVEACPEITDLKADIYILAVKDNAIANVAGQLRHKPLVHTSGAIDMETLSFFTEQYGVIYPFQTFRKQYEIDWNTVPVFIEACCPEFEQKIYELAYSLSPNIFRLSSEKRQYLHLAGVFTNNFVNHLLAVTKQIMEDKGLDYNWIFPLLDKTAENARVFDPKDIQTGPAVRGDSITIQKHLKLLSQYPELVDLYKVLSKSIETFHSTK